MSAGLIDVTGCNYTAGAWQMQYCASSQPDYSSMVPDAAQGNITVAVLISTFLWGAPLQAAPGESFSFSPAGYWLVVYIIEKLTGSTLAQYLTGNIFQPANLTSTYSGTPFSPGWLRHQLHRAMSAA